MESIAISVVMVEEDFEEARFRCHRIAVLAGGAGLFDIACLALEVAAQLGKEGTVPGVGYGQALLNLSSALYGPYRPR